MSIFNLSRVITILRWEVLLLRLSRIKILILLLIPRLYLGMAPSFCRTDF